MRSLMLAAVTTCLACAGAQNPGDPIAPDPARSRPTDSTASSSWFRRGLPPRLIVPLDGTVAARPVVQCPMPVAVPDAAATAPMPVLRPQAVPRMPIVRPGCVNPLFRRDTTGR